MPIRDSERCSEPKPRARPHTAFRSFLWLLGMALLLLVCASRASATNTPDTLPLTSIHDLLEGDHAASEHVLIRGTVTYSGHKFIVQDQTGAVAVHSAAPVSLALGDEVEVYGTLVVQKGIPLIDDAAVRHLWAGSTPLPLAMTPDEAAEGAYNGMLVMIEGRLMKTVVQASGAVRLTLDGGDQIFTCAMDANDGILPINPDTGATLQCTGVLSLEQPQDSFSTGTFAVLVRNGNDIRQVVPAPWWTARHITLLFIALLPVGFVIYRLHLRNVRRRMEGLVEERSRIAREIHDTLAQGFAGIALQLQGVSRTMGEQSGATNAHLAMALQMVRRSRAEAHRSIATLRTLHSSDELSSMIGRLARQLTGPAQLSLSVARSGVPGSLPDEVASHVLRISQEAVANAVEHASATAVSIAVVYAADSLLLEIRDDGHGFDPARIGSADTGHFGITGMRERASQIRATLTIDSGPNGTTIRLNVPIRRSVPWRRSRFGLPRQPKQRTHTVET